MDLHALRTSIFVREWSYPPSENFTQHRNGLARTACMLAYVQRRSVGKSTLARDRHQDGQHDNGNGREYECLYGRIMGCEQTFGWHGNGIETYGNEKKWKSWKPFPFPAIPHTSSDKAVTRCRLFHIACSQEHKSWISRLEPQRLILKGHSGAELHIYFLVHLESIYYEIFSYSKIVPNCAVAK